MRFWDSSCLVPLVVEERRSRACRDLVRADRGVWAWLFARLEVLAAIHRKRREGLLRDEEAEGARRGLSVLAARWNLVSASPEVEAQAEAIIGAHDLRSADALQLAAALVWCEGRANGRQFVAGDDRLLEAATAVGFTTIRPAG